MITGCLWNVCQNAFVSHPKILHWVIFYWEVVLVSLTKSSVGPEWGIWHWKALPEWSGVFFWAHCLLSPQCLYFLSCSWLTTVSMHNLSKLGQLGADPWGLVGKGVGLKSVPSPLQPFPPTPWPPITLFRPTENRKLSCALQSSPVYVLGMLCLEPLVLQYHGMEAVRWLAGERGSLSRPVVWCCSIISVWELCALFKYHSNVLRPAAWSVGLFLLGGMGTAILILLQLWGFLLLSYQLLGDFFYCEVNPI